RKIRSFRPQVITTYDENGGYPHPDHIMTHKITMVAFDGAADTGKYPEAEFGPAWQPLKVHYNQGFNRPRTQPLHDALLEGAVAHAVRGVRAHGALAHDGPPVHRRLRAPRQGADRARHAGRPGRRLVPGADGDPDGGLAHRGVRARQVPRGHLPPRGRGLRRHPGQWLT